MRFHLFTQILPKAGRPYRVSVHPANSPQRLLGFVDLLDRFVPLQNIQGLLGTAVPNQTYGYCTVVLPTRPLDLEGNILNLLPKS